MVLKGQTRCSLFKGSEKVYVFERVRNVVVALKRETGCICCKGSARVQLLLKGQKRCNCCKGQDEGLPVVTCQRRHNNCSRASEGV